MRGEHICKQFFDWLESGSSPLARGTPDHRHPGLQVVGIIPACAGNTRSCCHPPTYPWDHPRLRGEHKRIGTENRPSPGSSPLARGTRHSGGSQGDGHGIIPACAGNTGTNRCQILGLRDHPRLRGEHHRFPRNLHPSGRIIPACAGNTMVCKVSWRSAWDHPRLRGEHGHEAMGYDFETGSSPLARGTPHHACQPTQQFGIIPACAGNTCGVRISDVRMRDHPRLRGEHRMVSEFV
mgnify:CR=1 FL=1